MKYRLPKILRGKMLKKKASVQFWKVFLIEGGIFFLTSVLSVITAFELNKLAEAEKVYLPKSSLQDFLFSFLFVTFFILFFVVYKKTKKLKGIIYKGFFMLTVFWGGVVILNLFLPIFGAILIMGALIGLWLEFSFIWVHDALMVLGLAGSASFFGLGLSPPVAVTLLLVFSAYDFIAVYKTKHMVLMLKDMVEKKVILGFIIPKDLKYFKGKLARVKLKGDFMILGGGDVVFPAVLAVSIVPISFWRAITVAVFSLIGYFYSYWLFSKQKGKEPIPALPVIALFSIIGYLFALLA